MLELELVLVVELTTIHTSLQTPKNDTLLEITNDIAELIQIVRILTAKTLEIVLIGFS
jgi:hypothetical protein